MSIVRRVVRILVHGLTLLSLVLAIGLAFLWADPFGVVTRWQRPRAGWIAVNASAARAQGMRAVGTRDGRIYFAYETRGYRDGDLVIGRFVKWSLGCHLNIGVDDRDPSHKDISGYVPLAYPIAAFALPPTVLAGRAWKRRHLCGPGYCPSCGYDLRATPERCPECGQATPQPSPASR